jgi:hypothetical protein
MQERQRIERRELLAEKGKGNETTLTILFLFLAAKQWQRCGTKEI